MLKIDSLAYDKAYLCHFKVVVKVEKSLVSEVKGVQFFKNIITLLLFISFSVYFIITVNEFYYQMSLIIAQ